MTELTLIKKALLMAALVAAAGGLVPDGAHAQQAQRLQWRGRGRVGLPEYAITLSAPVLLRFADFTLPEPDGARLGGGILFDDAVRSALRLRSLSARGDADLFSDISWGSSMVYPYLDALLVAFLLDANPDVAWQLIVISTQSYALTSLFTQIPIYHAARERPGRAECAADASYSELCNSPSSWRSLPSGHTAGAFAGASLTCVHHTNLPLYGSEVADLGACGLALLWASAGAMARLMADRHWATDVLLGAGIGLSLGWLLPELVYYVELDRQEASLLLMPLSDGRSVGLVTAGGF